MTKDDHVFCFPWRRSQVVKCSLITTWVQHRVVHPATSPETSRDSAEWSVEVSPPRPGLAALIRRNVIISVLSGAAPSQHSVGPRAEWPQREHWDLGSKSGVSTLQVASELIRSQDSQSIIFHPDTYWTNITPIDLETPQWRWPEQTKSLICLAVLFPDTLNSKIQWPRQRRPLGRGVGSVGNSVGRWTWHRSLVVR